MESKSVVKIAIPTDDGETISAHFGRAPFFVVVTLNEGEAPQFEKRSKAYHGSTEHTPEADHHGHDHHPMFAPIADCQVLLAGGMGQPAYDHAAAAGLEVLMTGEKSITAAVDTYRSGLLVSDPRRIHRHR